MEATCLFLRYLTTSQRTQHLCSSWRVYQTVYRTYKTKPPKHILRNLIRQNQENLMLFGPKLKAIKSKTSTKKKNKMLKTKSVPKPKGLLASESGNVEDEFVTTDSDTFCDQSQWDPYFTDKDMISDILYSETEQSEYGADTYTSIPEKTHIPVPILKESKWKYPGGCESSELENPVQDLSFIDGLQNVSLCLDQTAVDSGLHTFRSHVERLSLPSLPSVNAILNKTQSEMSRFYLERWKQQMVNKLGEDGFKRYQQETLSNGINLHANIQQFLMGERDIQIQPGVEGYWQSLERVLSKVEDVVACEQSVSHAGLMYTGKFDCVAVYRNSLCVIDWKTSQKPKPLLSNTFDSPLQVAAYVGAINSSAEFEFGPVTNAAIVVAYPWGEPAHVHVMGRAACEQYWSKWLQRLAQYWRTVAGEQPAGG